MEKIYSRKTIRAYNISKIKILIFLSILLIIFSVFFYIKIAIPIIEASSRNLAYSKVNDIVTSEIKKLMKDYTYNDLINFERNNEGEVTLLKTNTIKINELIARLTQDIQNNIDNEERSNVFLNFGSITGLSVLRFIGPKFEIEFETAGDSKVELESEFEATGINQTIHKIYANVEACIKIITPFGAYNEKMKSKVLLTEAVIVGKVPNTYLNLEMEK